MFIEISFYLIATSVPKHIHGRTVLTGPMKLQKLTMILWRSLVQVHLMQPTACGITYCSNGGSQLYPLVRLYLSVCITGGFPGRNPGEAM